MPSDKARAVVDAMERDMGTPLATKQDLEIQRVATKRDLDVLGLAIRQDIDMLRRDMEGRFALVDQKLAGLESRLQHRIDTFELRLTVKLGSMMVVGFGLMIAATRVWG